MSKEDGEQFGFDEFERLSYFRSDQGKSNLAPAAKKANWFKIENVELANGDFVGVVTPWDRPDEAENRDANIAADALFLDLLDKLWNQDRFVNASSGRSYAPKVLAEQPEARKRKINKKALEAAMERLFTAGIIELEDYGKPSNPHKRIRRRPLPPTTVTSED